MSERYTEMINPIMWMDRLLTQSEAYQIHDICYEEVEKNRIAQDGRYFRAIVVKNSRFNQDHLVEHLRIEAIGAYFNDRLLIDFEGYTLKSIGKVVIYLDDHSGPENHNNDCAVRLQKYLLSIGAHIADEQI